MYYFLIGPISMTSNLDSPVTQWQPQLDGKGQVAKLISFCASGWLFMLSMHDAVGLRMVAMLLDNNGPLLQPSYCSTNTAFTTIAIAYHADVYLVYATC